MHDPIRQEVVQRSTTVVVKVGTRVLTHEDGTLNHERINSLAEQIARLMEAQRHVVLVSSGAVGAGIGRLQLSERPADLAHLQAVAAIGQSRLIESYNRALEPHGRHAAQILLTADDLNDRMRYLNVRNTLLALFQYGALPIVNENDTVRVDELQRNVGDNDRLAAMVTNLIRAPLLILLSDVDGLFDRHPGEEGATTIPLVRDFEGALRGFQRQAPVASGTNMLSKGGMASKLEAAKLALTAGEHVIIANGRRPEVLGEIFAGKVVGTLFQPQGPTVGSKKRWIGLTARPNGKLFVDSGAHEAVSTKGKSLLAAGLRRSEGKFQKGDIVALCQENGSEFGRGLTNYSAEEVQQILGKSTGDISVILGHCRYDEVIHRDNLVVFS